MPLQMITIISIVGAALAVVFRNSGTLKRPLQSLLLLNLCDSESNYGGGTRFL